MISDSIRKSDSPWLESDKDVDLLADYIARAIRAYRNHHPQPSELRPFSQEEAIRFFGKTRQTLATWRKRGIIQAYRIRGRIYYKPEELVNALERI